MKPISRTGPTTRAPGGPVAVCRVRSRCLPLSVHHLDAESEADLFRSIARALRPGGRSVTADVAVPENPGDEITPINGVYEKPSRADEQPFWLKRAGLVPQPAWSVRHFAGPGADRPV